MTYRIAFLTLMAVLIFGSEAVAQTADEIVANVNARDEGISQTRDAALTLTDKRGKTREQTIRAYRKYYGKEKRTIIFYLEPANVKDTSFLTIDYPGVEQEDDQWLYLPAMRKVRRISASNKGDYFLGTDLTYDDLKRDAKMSAEDYNWSTAGSETVNGVEALVLEGVPVDEETADELGYGKAKLHVDPNTWMVLRYEYWDVNGNPLKVLRNLEIVGIEGYWTANRIEAENAKTGHSTVIDFSDTVYGEEIDDELFSEAMMRRGAPR